MKILGLGVPELVVILLVVLLIFGPKNLPKLGSAIGKTFKNLREGMDGKKKDADEAAASSEETPAEQPVATESVETVEPAAEKKAES
ncbi:MAG: twin-arginine translocase TatA/TatE family subunit [Coriobacteriales bacterium]